MLKSIKSKNRDPTPSADPTPKHRSHLQVQKLLQNGLLCHLPPLPYRPPRNERGQKSKWKHMFWNYKNGQKKKRSTKTYLSMTRRKKKMSEPFFKL